MNFPQSMVLAVTGGIACGKTEAGQILMSDGFRVLDTDTLAHELMKKGTPIHTQITDRFGGGILKQDGEIDRDRLGKTVFSDPDELKELNGIVHPAVISAAEKWIQERRDAEEDSAVLVPLLYEAGWTGGWDAVICVTAPEETVFRRLEKRGLSQEESARRISSQMPLSEKSARADAVVRNDGTLDGLRDQIRTAVEKIRGKQRKKHE